ncbi:hypothetical protein A3860_08110 [Niastella vici]|uniref:Outer membrane protein beta-barrel domain-containing protein n=1 Tax=Niastella vici TaxID=1703345 RepID=A0A1V9FIS9_9BACT|nr:hypothetical protein [Niastella vici]OQP58273.1 hypothetical protein A3860_08110 [Niastella vici]
MKKLTFPIFLLLASLQSMAQNKTITLDYSKPLTIDSQKVDVTKPLVIHATNCKSSITNPLKIEILYGNADKPSQTLVCDKDIAVDIPAIFKTDGAKQEITVSIRADKTKAGDNELTVSFKIKPDGTLTSASQQTPDGKPGTAGTPLPESTVDFVNPAYLTAVYKAPDNCRKPVVTYNPCCNIYAVKDNETTADEKEYLRYYSRLSKNKGVVFLIKNFNTFKYDITLSNTFDNNVTEEPALFKTVFTLMSPSAVAAKTPGMEAELVRLVKLNKDLKNYLDKKMNDGDCISSTDFETEKKAIVDKIKTEFKTAGDVLNFDDPYNTAKDKFITTERLNNPAYSSADFNKRMQTEYSLPVTPDSIVTETKKILRLLVNTSFEYQYNVPQLQNADAITFNLNIKPKEGINAPVHVTDQPITIPIRFGWKVDFTTGVYYSSMRNEKYALRDVIQGDSVIGKDLVKEGGDNFGKSSVGINALMHIFPRLGHVQPALSLGVGTSLDLNYSLLLGASVILGRQNRFALSAGANWSSIKTLSAKYLDDNGKMVRQVKTVTSIDMHSKVKSGFFVSLTYSLGLTSKTQKVAGTENTAKPEAADKKDEKKEENK